jgi:hypothetical protein
VCVCVCGCEGGGGGNLLLRVKPDRKNTGTIHSLCPKLLGPDVFWNSEFFGIK